MRCPVLGGRRLTGRLLQERESGPPTDHLTHTVAEMRCLNGRRKLKGAVLAAVSSARWLPPPAEPGSGPPDAADEEAATAGTPAGTSLLPS